MPFTIFTAIAVLLIIATQTAYSRIRSQYQNFTDLNAQVESLEIKQSSLSSINLASLDPSNRSVIAVPQDNPGLFMLSQLNLLGQKFGVEVDGRSLGQGSDFAENLTRAQIVFSLGSDNLGSIIAFLKETTKIAPLSTVEKVTISQGGLTGFQAGVEMYVYWSPFPENVPPLTSPLRELSVEDKETLSKILGLSIPAFTVLDPSSPGFRPDPFR